MTVSQDIQLENSQDKSYFDTITITDVPQGQFPAVISNSIAEGASTREMEVQLMVLEQSQGGTMTADPGLFVRNDGETAIQVKVLGTDGSEVASNTTDYPS